MSYIQLLYIFKSKFVCYKIFVWLFSSEKIILILGFIVVWVLRDLLAVGTCTVTVAAPSNAALREPNM
jgi:hypothetical protein